MDALSTGGKRVLDPCCGSRMFWFDRQNTDVVFDPFSGVGSTGYQAIKMGRKFAGSELKKSYFDQACKNIASAKADQGALFSEAA